MGCGCGKKRKNNPIHTSSLRTASAGSPPPQVSYVVMASSGSDISKHETLDEARSAWSAAKKTDPGARLIQRTTQP